MSAADVGKRALDRVVDGVGDVAGGVSNAAHNVRATGAFVVDTAKARAKRNIYGLIGGAICFYAGSFVAGKYAVAPLFKLAGIELVAKGVAVGGLVLNPVLCFVAAAIIMILASYFFGKIFNRKNVWGPRIFGVTIPMVPLGISIALLSAVGGGAAFLFYAVPKFVGGVIGLNIGRAAGRAIIRQPQRTKYFRKLQAPPPEAEASPA